MKDKKLYNLIKKEEKRQRDVINLIASENYVSQDVLDAVGSVFTNKYAEGYARARYYAGNEVVDKLEELVKERAFNLFIKKKTEQKKWDVNVQAYSGSPANIAVFHAIVPLGNKIMAMDLSMGGHLTHGSRASITGKLWKQVPYGVDKKTECINYKEVMKIAKKEKPKLIIAGGSAYSRIIDFKNFRKIADAVGAIFMVDMSHIAGLVAGGAHPSPFPYADVITTTTHKTLRGPRGAIIFSKIKFSKLINKTIFPGIQGGPHENQIAGIAVALFEARQPGFKKYIKQVIKNAKTLSGELKKMDWKIISGGTDTHLFLIDTYKKSISGKKASDILEKNKIIVNKNMIPYDAHPPLDPSGIRIGTAAITTRGMKEKDMKYLAKKIDVILKNI